MRKLLLLGLLVVSVSVFSSAVTYVMIWSYQIRGVIQHNPQAYLPKLAEHLTNAQAADLSRNDQILMADALRLEGNKNLPVQIEVSNTSDGSDAMAELRATNGICGGNLFVASETFSDNSNFLANEAGLTAESGCAGLHIRSNGNQYIRFSVGDPPREVLRLTSDGAIHIRGGEIRVEGDELKFVKRP